MSSPKRGTPDLISLGAPSPLGNRQQLDEYNYEHFRPKHLLAPLALRATPLPTEARVALGGVAAATLGAAWLLRRRAY
jgi:hypothetical protein